MFGNERNSLAIISVLQGLIHKFNVVSIKTPNRWFIECGKLTQKFP